MEFFFPLQLTSASPTDTPGLPLPFFPSVSVCLDDLFFSLFFIFIFLSSAAPASSSTPVPLSHLDSEYHFRLPSPCRWLSAGHSVSDWHDLLHQVIIPLCWWRAARGFRGADEMRRRHRATQDSGGAALSRRRRVESIARDRKSRRQAPEGCGSPSPVLQIRSQLII